MKPKPKAGPGRLKRILKRLIPIAMLIVFVIVFDTMGLAYFAGFMLVWSLYRLYIFRDQVVGLKHYIETFIWGKPLKMFSKQELRNTKVKFKWRKRNMRSKKEDLEKQIKLNKYIAYGTGAIAFVCLFLLLTSRYTNYAIGFFMFYIWSMATKVIEILQKTRLEIMESAKDGRSN